MRPIQIQGEASKNGNRKFQLNINEGYILFKINRLDHIKIQLPKLRKNIFKELLCLDYLSKLKQIPFMISLDEKFIQIIFDETKIQEENQKVNKIKNRILGIDLNPNYIGLSIVDFKSDVENIVFKQVIDLKQLNELTYQKSSSKESKKRTNKKNFETIEICKQISNLARHYKVEKVSLEDLKIKSSDKGKGKTFNRLCNNDWNRNLLIQNLSKRLILNEIELIKVNPAYSSFIGNINYGSENCPDMIASSIELARRGQKKYIKGEFYPIYKNIDNLKNLWKKDLDWSFYSWKELFLMMKEMKMEMKYRFPITSDSVFRKSNMSSLKSKIVTLQFL